MDFSSTSQGISSQFLGTPLMLGETPPNQDSLLRGIASVAVAGAGDGSGSRTELGLVAGPVIQAQSGGK